MPKPGLTDEQIARLPKAARMELERLTRDLAAARRRLEPPEGATVRAVAEPYSDNPLPLPEVDTVQFRLPGGALVDVSLRSDGFLKVSSDDPLLVSPQTSNGVHLYVMRAETLRRAYAGERETVELARLRSASPD